MCGRTTEWKLLPTTRATEPLLPMWPSLTLSDSSVMPPRTRWHVIPRTRLLDNDKSHLLCILLGYVEHFSPCFFDGKVDLDFFPFSSLIFAVKSAKDPEVFDAKRLIGRKFADPIVQADIKLWPFKCVAGQGDKPMIIVNAQGEAVCKQKICWIWAKHKLFEVLKAELPDVTIQSYMLLLIY